MSELLNHINALLNVKKIKLDFDTVSLPKYFSADSELLLRAVMNVISNAVDYSPENSTIGFTAQLKDDYIYFSITDSGKGFSNEATKLATQQFYMGDHGRTSRNHYGMGLYITKTIIESHGGSINISNAKDGGGQVVLKIPAGKSNIIS
jgi:signal transduction histidine kinase